MVSEHAYDVDDVHDVYDVYVQVNIYTQQTSPYVLGLHEFCR